MSLPPCLDSPLKGIPPLVEIGIGEFASLRREGVEQVTHVTSTNVESAAFEIRGNQEGVRAFGLLVHLYRSLVKANTNSSVIPLIRVKWSTRTRG